MRLNTGYTRTVVPIFDPLNTTNKQVTWNSEDPGVVEVKDGVITALSEGTADITATTLDGTKVARSRVTVLNPVVRVSLDTDKRILNTGETRQLAASVIPDNATNARILWQSTNSEVAAVDETGTVIGLSPGRATTTATAEAGRHTASCEVTVKVPVTGVTLTEDVIGLVVGERRELDAVVLPFQASNKAVLWSSDNERVASVDERGTVTGLSPGRAAITVTTVDGSYSDSLTATVVGEDSLPAISRVKISGSPEVSEHGQYVQATDTALLTFTVAHDRPVVQRSTG